MATTRLLVIPPTAPDLLRHVSRTLNTTAKLGGQAEVSLASLRTRARLVVDQAGALFYTEVSE